MHCTGQTCVMRVPLFNHLDMKDQMKINELVQHKTYKKGEIIFSPKSQSQLVVVSKGSMKVYQLSLSGKEQLLRIINEGDYEGENQLFGIKNDVVFGEALEHTEVCFIKQEDFANLLLTYPKLSLKLLTLNAQKAENMKRQTHFLIMEKVEERLASYLMNLSKAEESLTIEIPMKLQELATFIGTTPETLSRKLKLLEDEKVITRRQRTIEIIDSVALSHYY